MMLCKLVWIPVDWALYFLDPMPPYEAVKKSEVLREALTENGQEVATTLLGWARLV